MKFALASILSACASASWAAVPERAEIELACSRPGGQVVAECVEAVTDAFTVEDEYMRVRHADRARRIMLENRILPPRSWLPQSPEARAAEARRAQDAKLRAELAQVVEQARAQCVKLQIPLDQVRIGMLSWQADACGWGGPLSKRKVTDENGVVEYWHYGDNRKLVFRNGKLAVIEE